MKRQYIISQLLVLMCMMGFQVSAHNIEVVKTEDAASDGKNITVTVIEQSLKIFGIEIDIDGLMGDVNSDGTVDADDIEEVANAIVGKPSENYNKAAADMDDNDIVDVLDLTRIVEIVKSKH